MASAVRGGTVLAMRGNDVQIALFEGKRGATVGKFDAHCARDDQKRFGTRMLMEIDSAAETDEAKGEFAPLDNQRLPAAGQGGKYFRQVDGVIHEFSPHRR